MSHVVTKTFISNVGQSSFGKICSVGHVVLLSVYRMGFFLLQWRNCSSGVSSAAVGSDGSH